MLAVHFLFLELFHRFSYQRPAHQQAKTEDYGGSGRFAGIRFSIGCESGVNPGASVAPQTRERVLAAARELGYLPNAIARSLISGRSREVGGYTASGARVATLSLMGASQPPDAIFVANDHMAFTVMDTLRDGLQLDVPSDVSVVGFDDVPQASWGAYSLTTVSQNTEALIEATVTLLFDQLQTGHAVTTKHCVPVSLVKRKST